MTTDEAMSAYVNLSAVMVQLSEGKSVTLDKTDLDWLSAVHMLTPMLPLPEGPYDVVAVPRVFGER